MAPQDETELFWQAFRYVGQEMTPDEAADFEVRLASDQAARETIARVVELSQLVLAVAPERSPAEEFVSPVLQSRAWMQPVGWIAVGAAACLAVVMAYQSWIPVSGPTQLASLAPGSTGDLALAWAIARADLPGTEEATATPPANGDAASRSADGVVPEGAAFDRAASDVAVQAKANGELGATGTLAAGDELPSTDPMEEFTEPVAPGWLLVAVEDARKGASQEN
jgi:negative regulator of sigma E activity